MSFINIEIKARTQLADEIRKFLLEKNALFKGVDHQTDTYFNVSRGRLKLRQGNIENNLIYYERENKAGPKQSDFKLVPVQDAEGLKQALTLALGIKVIVAKKREIYFIENVKFHIDELEALGKFVEIEASNIDKDLSVDELRAQCDYYMNIFKIQEKDLIQHSYSDMLLGA